MTVYNIMVQIDTIKSDKRNTIDIEILTKDIKDYGIIIKTNSITMLQKTLRPNLIKTWAMRRVSDHHQMETMDVSRQEK